ncbi:hypothetical protein HKX48_001674 [Thoreauomyces humboldtii]|nr:hypothetical protein HKX48_001674 [Thoreauomyces humboldtii]
MLDPPPPCLLSKAPDPSVAHFHRTAQQTASAAAAARSSPSSAISVRAVVTETTLESGLAASSPTTTDCAACSPFTSDWELDPKWDRVVIASFHVPTLSPASSHHASRSPPRSYLKTPPISRQSLVDGGKEERFPSLAMALHEAVLSDLLGPSSESDVDTDELLCGRIVHKRPRAGTKRKSRRKHCPTSDDTDDEILPFPVVHPDNEMELPPAKERPSVPGSDSASDFREPTSRLPTSTPPSDHSDHASGTEQPRKPKPKLMLCPRPSPKPSNLKSRAHTTGASRMVRASPSGVKTRKSVYLDADHVLEEHLVDWLVPSLRLVIETYIRQEYCLPERRQWRDKLVSDFCYLSLSKEYSPLQKLASVAEG